MLALAGLPDAQDKAGRIYELESQLAAGHWDRVAVQGQLADVTTRWTAPGLDALLPAAALGRLAGRPRRRTVRAGAGRRPAARLRHRAGRPADARTGCRPGRTGWPGRSSGRAPRSARPIWWRRTSTSTAAPCPGRRSCGSAGSAAWRSSRRRAGEAVGRLYVERHFPPEAKAQMDGWSRTCWRRTAQDISDAATG